MRGRPSALTPEIQEAILSVIREGNYRDVAAKAAGVSPRTLQSWCQQGRKGEAEVMVNFLRALLKAEQDAEILMVGLVAKAARDDAKHAEWYLERKFPERWGRDTAAIKDLDRRLKDFEKRDGKTP